MGEDQVNPVARSNVCPVVAPPAEPGIFAFSYTVPEPHAGASFIVAGSAEAPEGKGDYRDHAIARGDLSPEGLRRKADWVLGEMERRMPGLGFDWQDASAVQICSVHDFHPLVFDLMGKRGVLDPGLGVALCQPDIASPNLPEQTGALVPLRA